MSCYDRTVILRTLRNVKTSFLLMNDGNSSNSNNNASFYPNQNTKSDGISHVTVIKSHDSYDFYVAIRLSRLSQP